jgi:SAM-dependent methyltransferase
VKVLTLADLANRTFDFINTEQIFEHVAQPLETLRALKDTLEPHGLIKISVPEGRDIKRRLAIQDWEAPKGSKNSLNAASPLEHLNCFTWESLIRMADLAGLLSVRIPLGVQYRAKTNWRSPRHSLKNLLKPLHQNFIKKGTYLFFRKKSIRHSA